MKAVQTVRADIDRQADMTKRVAAFRDNANTPKTWLLWQCCAHTGIFRQRAHSKFAEKCGWVMQLDRLGYNADQY
jgi:hypothetical protein